MICVEAQPMSRSTQRWRIVDARSGQLTEGHAELSILAKRIHWDVGEIEPGGEVVRGHVTIRADVS